MKKTRVKKTNPLKNRGKKITLNYNLKTFRCIKLKIHLKIKGNKKP
jgi:hypothetical protein